MANTRRIGTTDSASRTHLLDVAEEMLLDEGYPAVTSRRLGARAEVSPQLVHYYFRTMDDLFTEVFRRRAEQGLERVARALEVDGSLTAIWELTSNPLGSRFNLEFAALANHRKEIRAEIAEYGERYRRLQSDAGRGTLRGAGHRRRGAPADRRAARDDGVVADHVDRTVDRTDDRARGGTRVRPGAAGTHRAGGTGAALVSVRCAGAVGLRGGAAGAGVPVRAHRHRSPRSASGHRRTARRAPSSGARIGEGHARW